MSDDCEREDIRCVSGCESQIFQPAVHRQSHFHHVTECLHRRSDQLEKIGSIELCSERNNVKN
jgi:hypothetical protein